MTSFLFSPHPEDMRQTAMHGIKSTWLEEFEFENIICFSFVHRKGASYSMVSACGWCKQKFPFARGGITFSHVEKTLCREEGSVGKILIGTDC